MFAACITCVVALTFNNIRSKINIDTCADEGQLYMTKASTQVYTCTYV